jgi:hypothetical protein
VGNSSYLNGDVGITTASAFTAAWCAMARQWLLHDEVFALSTRVSQKVCRARWGRKTLTQAVARRGGGRKRPTRWMTTRGRATLVVACGEEKACEARNASGFLRNRERA